MQTVISISVNCKKVNLLFANYRAAEAFRDFVITYVDEGGASNGRLAYWAELNASMHETKINPEDLNEYVTTLNQEYLDKMFGAIVNARTLDEGTAMSVSVAFISSPDGLKFVYEKFPNRIEPEIKDMCRFLLTEGAPQKFDGVVVGKNSGILSVVDPFKADLEAKISFDTKIIKIPVSQTMKIRDWRR